LNSPLLKLSLPISLLDLLIDRSRQALLFFNSLPEHRHFGRRRSSQLEKRIWNFRIHPPTSQVMK
ncbi:unnamed protein product, partial [Linum tenue]